MVAVCGWHLHRHHRGPQFLIDTTNTGWGLLSGHQRGPLLGHQWVLFHGHGQSDDLTRSFPIAKNPFMSAYLSAANRVANTAWGKATNEIKRQSKRQTTSMVNAWVDAWTPRSRRSPARKRKSS